MCLFFCFIEYQQRLSAIFHPLNKTYLLSLFIFVVAFPNWFLIISSNVCLILCLSTSVILFVFWFFALVFLLENDPSTQIICIFFSRNKRLTKLEEEQRLQREEERIEQLRLHQEGCRFIYLSWQPSIFFLFIIKVLLNHELISSTLLSSYIPA